MEMRHIKIDITKGGEEEAIKMKQGIKIGNYGVRMENPEISKMIFMNFLKMFIVILFNDRECCNSWG